MKKAIATQTIVYLVLGIIVIAVLGYLLWQKFIENNRMLDEATCNTRQLTYCAKLSQCNYDCVPFSKTFDEYAPGCSSRFGIGASRPECEIILT